jgi:ubiquinone/menaquinone biosynthesis C-methylase UbiE
VEKSFDRVADIYDDTRRMPPDVVARIMKNIMSEVDPSCGVVLEMGIGTGRIAVPLAERGFRVVGVDIAEKMLARLRDKAAEARGNICVVRGSIEALPFADGSFHAVIAVHVFHLLDNVGCSVSEARRVLSPDGCLLFGGEQRLLRSVQQVLCARYGLNEDLIGMLEEAGTKSSDQDRVDVTWADIIERIEGRIASDFWNIPEKAMNTLVERLRTLFATHVGPPSTVLRFKRKFTMFSARF